MINSILGKVGILILIEYLYIRIRFRIINILVEVGMLICIECMCLVGSIIILVVLGIMIFGDNCM